VINRKGGHHVSEPKLQGKSYDIPKQLVWDAWVKVRSKRGAAGADGVTIPQFEEDVKNNLYKLWNRMSSGSYFPGPVRAVEIPKKGGTRVLGIPNVVDRIAQTVAVLVIEPNAEQVFHDDSYGYRPGRSPEDAVGMCRGVRVSRSELRVSSLGDHAARSSSVGVGQGG
jgi:RNA-directed DNA polymerase